MDIETIRSQILDPKLSAVWIKTAEDYPPAGKTGRVSCLKYITARRDAIVTTIADIKEPDQMPETMAIVYIDLKGEWIMLNTVMNYQLMRNGKCDPKTVLKGSLISSLLSCVEQMLSQADVDAISKFLAAPIRPPVADVVPPTARLKAAA
jgi:hypothetical protein